MKLVSEPATGSQALHRSPGCGEERRAGLSGGRLAERLVSDQRGSLFVEFLFVFPALALLLLLGQWVARWNGARSEVQEQVASCAAAYAVGGCNAVPPACGDVTMTVQDYGGGPTPTGLGGKEVIATRLVSIAQPQGLSTTPTPYRSTYRIACNVPEGPFQTNEVVRNVCLSNTDPRVCAVW